MGRVVCAEAPLVKETYDVMMAIPGFPKDQSVWLQRLNVRVIHHESKEGILHTAAVAVHFGGQSGSGCGKMDYIWPLGA